MTHGQQTRSVSVNRATRRRGESAGSGPPAAEEIGVAAIGVAAIGVAAIGVAAIGVAAIGVAAIGVAAIGPGAAATSVPMLRSRSWTAEEMALGR